MKISEESPENEFEVIERFSISRTVKSTDENSYRINDRKSSNDEVIKLLKSKGVDLVHNRFMIL